MLIGLRLLLVTCNGHEKRAALRAPATPGRHPLHCALALGSPCSDGHDFAMPCSKPIKRAELIARIGAHLRLKADSSWVNSLASGAMKDDAEAMKILKSILPENIITRIKVIVTLAILTESLLHQPLDVLLELHYCIHAQYQNVGLSVGHLPHMFSW